MRKAALFDERFLKHLVTSALSSGKAANACSRFINNLGLPGARRGIVLVLVLTWEIDASLAQDLILPNDLKARRPDIYAVLTGFEAYKAILEGADPGKHVDTFVVGIFPKWDAAGIFTVLPLMTKMVTP
jgi:hypothetical protein